MKKLNVIGTTRIWLGISAVLMLLSITAIAVYGLNFGIDFTGGSLIELRMEQPFTVADVREKVNGEGYDAIVQESEGNQVFIRLETISQEEHDAIISALSESYGTVEELRFESVGPVFGQELKRKSLIAVILLSIIIVIYVAWAFRTVSKPVASWKYGVLTMVAGAHDVILPLGVFAVLGHFLGYQVDTAFVAALLTILGFSVNDTIVIFDRTRENLIKNRHSDESFGDIVNKSVVQSFARSMNTSVTVLLVLLAIFFFGGTTTKPFIMALIVGIISGVYSSIFVASTLLVLWEKKSRAS